MASSKRIGFYWGEEKITVVEFDNNTAHKVVSSIIDSKSAPPSALSASLNEEIQGTKIVQKILQDNRMTGRSFYVSLPMKEIVLRSFIIPTVKRDEIQSVIRFESKKYVPFDIQEMSFVYHTIPIVEGQNKNLQVIFYAVRNDALVKYGRIFTQAQATVSYCEPCMVSLAKALLFRKEIRPTDNLAFLILGKNLGSICFIDQGIPKFIREFSLRVSESEEGSDSMELLNSKILNEVGNSFDFYARQFSGDRIKQVLVSSEFVQKDLLNTLESELKVNIRKFSPLFTTGVADQNNDLDAIFAMGACIEPPLGSLSEFNFLTDKTAKPKFDFNLAEILQSSKDIIVTFVVCALILAGVYVFFQSQMKLVQQQYTQMSLKEGEFVNTPLESIQSEIQQNDNTLTSLKNIRTKSDMTLILLRIASHLPKGVLLTSFNISYNQGDTNNDQVIIDIKGDVLNQEINQQMSVVQELLSDFKNDKDLLRFVSTVKMTSLDLEDYKGQKVTGFSIHCS